MVSSFWIVCRQSPKGYLTTLFYARCQLKSVFGQFMADLGQAIPTGARERVNLTSHPARVSASAVLSSTIYSEPRPPSLMSINLPTTGLSFRPGSGFRMAKASIRSTFNRSYFRFSSIIRICINLGDVHPNRIWDRILHEKLLKKLQSLQNHKIYQSNVQVIFNDTGFYNFSRDYAFFFRILVRFGLLAVTISVAA